MKDYRVKRPSEYGALLNLLRDKENGVFNTLKSALVFSAIVGFNEGRKLSFVETDEPIALRLFSEETDIPLMYLIALSEYKDITYLREENFENVVKLFEEYAAGGLQFLDSELDKDHTQSSIERIVFDSVHGNNKGDIISSFVNL